MSFISKSVRKIGEIGSFEIEGEVHLTIHRGVGRCMERSTAIKIMFSQ
jgi:hypothetical protein